MSEMREYRVRCVSAAGFHHTHCVEWGDPANPRVLMCVHGLTRCSRDFDDLARALAADYRVVCPDVVGRGQSDWLRDKQLYGPPQYVADMTSVLAFVAGRAPIGLLHWVGTSMGGLIGMAMAALPDSPVARLVLNDVGPVVTAASLARIGEYVGKAPAFANFGEAVKFVRAVSLSFGTHTDDEWRRLTAHVTRTTSAGTVEFRYDPGIAATFAQAAAANPGKDVELWPLYDAIRCPTLLVRGAQSDLLTDATATAMTERGPRAERIDIPGVGHAPTLMHADQIDGVRDFLRAG